MDGLIALALAKKYADSVGQSIISAGFRVQVEQDRSILETTGEEKVLYLLPKASSNLSNDDGYDEFVYANNEWEWVGKTDVDLDYEELDNLPKINGVELFGDKYHHQLKLFGCLPVQNEVERLETVLDLDDSKNAISSVSISRNGYFPLSMNPRYRKIIVSDYQNPNGDGLVDILFWQDDDSKQAKMAFRVSPTGKYDSGISSWRELTGGSQIVSAVVNQNGTITFTDSGGNTFTTTGSSVIGADGFSPTATVTQTASGATVSITDKNGTTTANISNGADGQDYVLTAQDKSDIADIVLSELPTTQGVLYGNTSN